MPLADFTLKNDDAADVGTLKYWDFGDGEIGPISMIVVDIAGVATPITGDAANGLDVDVTRCALPTGASTAANQSTANTALAAIQTAAEAIKTATETLDNVVAGSEAQVDIVSSALPTGAATSARQDTGNTSLASIDSKITVVDTNDVVISSSALPTGAATAANQTTIISHLDGVETLLTDIDAGKLEEATFTGRIGEVQANPTANTVLARLKDLLSLVVLAAGDNNIGNVDLASAIPAGTNLIGKAAVGQDAKVLYDGTTAVTVKRANIDTATANNNAIVAAVLTKKIRVISVSLFASGAVDVYFNDGTANLLGGTRKVKLDNTGAVGAGGLVLQQNLTGWFETADVNRPLNLNLSGAVGVAGCLTYVEVD